jgi:hypothetical protein
LRRVSLLVRSFEVSLLGLGSGHPNSLAGHVGPRCSEVLTSQSGGFLQLWWLPPRCPSSSGRGSRVARQGPAARAISFARTEAAARSVQRFGGFGRRPDALAGFARCGEPRCAPSNAASFALSAERSCEIIFADALTVSTSFAFARLVICRFSPVSAIAWTLHFDFVAIGFASSCCLAPQECGVRRSRLRRFGWYQPSVAGRSVLVNTAQDNEFRAFYPETMDSG